MSTTFSARLTAVNLLRRGIEFANEGNKDEARVLIAQACLANPTSDRAWLWRASLAPSTADAMTWLERCLTLNPGNETAKRWLEKLRPAISLEREPAKPAEPAWTCPFCSLEADAEQKRCSACGGITELDMGAFATNTLVSERQLRHAAEHYAKVRADGDPSYDYFLGLALLNLRRSYEAHICLSQYFRLNPKDEEVRQAVAVLQTRKLVLSVDDSPTVRMVVADALERAGYRTATACSGVDAVGFVLREAVPDFILLDVSMPVMDGYELCKTIKSVPRVKHVPVVMLSGNDGFVDKVRGRMAGAVDYLIKPFNASALIKLIQKHADKGVK